MFYLTNDSDLHYKSIITAFYFYSQRMPLHKKMVSMISKIESKYPNINFFAIDTDFFNTFIKRFNLELLPTIIVFDNGKEMDRFTGVPLLSAFKSFFVDIYKSVSKNKENKDGK